MSNSLIILIDKISTYPGEDSGLDFVKPPVETLSNSYDVITTSGSPVNPDGEYLGRFRISHTDAKRLVRFVDALEVLYSYESKLLSAGCFPFADFTAYNVLADEYFHRAYCTFKVLLGSIQPDLYAVWESKDFDGKLLEVYLPYDKIKEWAESK